LIGGLGGKRGRTASATGAGAAKIDDTGSGATAFLRDSFAVGTVGVGFAGGFITGEVLFKTAGAIAVARLGVLVKVGMEI